VWSRDNFCEYPWRHTSNRFHALVAEVMLQRTRAEQVERVYNEFAERFPDAQSLAAADLSDIEALLRSLGLRWRAPLLHNMAKELSRNAGEIPTDPDVLSALPGLGQYSVSAYLSLHAGQRMPIIDSNIVRFYGRFLGFRTGPETRRASWLLELADRLTPRRWFREFNYAVLDFSRMICKPSPSHSNCPLIRKCSLYRSSLSLSLNVRKGKCG